jgi:hypothetical protein
MKDEIGRIKIGLDFILQPSGFILSYCPHPCPLPEYRARGKALLSSWIGAAT